MANDLPNKNPPPSRDLEKPYLTPKEVSQDQDVVAAGFVRSKRMWLGLLSVVIAGGALAAFSYRQSSYIQNFGNMRRGPIEDVEVDFDGIEFDDNVREFGMRRSYPVQSPAPADSSPASASEIATQQ
ncbi:hypothetical protein [Planctomycetes bacterium K23_9]|uniref:Uncharacterized protein n=1 Tax=Stieleria marina TaxID=1930275 RepID=A0A517P0B2_9BACT|nr:hypothetical protein K239x_48270 [Planctomycetes bacterium K23_9]